jgi:ribosomal protein S27E
MRQQQVISGHGLYLVRKESCGPLLSGGRGGGGQIMDYTVHRDNAWGRDRLIALFTG